MTFISVVLPAYNAERFVAQSIESMLTQSHGDFELLAINDGSTDRTLDILRRYEAQDERIRVLDHENWGMGKSLNHAIELAQAEWIARIDADDLMEPERLERQVAFLHENPHLAVFSSLVTFLNADGQVLGRSQPAMTTREEFKRARDEGVVMGLFHPAAMIRRRAVLDVGGYRDQFWPADDLDLWTRIAEAGGEIIVQPEYLTRYRVHQKSSSFGDAREMSTLMSWIRQCTENRRSGITEPTREEFLKDLKELPIHRRLRRARGNYAYAFYRQATLAYTSRDVMWTFAWLAAAALLGSSDVYRQLSVRLFKPVSARLRPLGSASSSGGQITAVPETRSAPFRKVKGK